MVFGLAVAVTVYVAIQINELDKAYIPPVPVARPIYTPRPQPKLRHPIQPRQIRYLTRVR